MSNRFKQLADTFNMDELSSDSDTDNDSVDNSTAPTTDELMVALEQAKDLDKQFSRMNHYDVHDNEMDELAKLAVDAHKSLQELGMNVEIRHAGEIFSSSSQMLKIAVDAKNSKVDKKLRLMKLQLDKLRIDKQYKDSDAVEGTAVKLDRNELMKQLKSLPTDEN